MGGRGIPVSPTPQRPRYRPEVESLVRQERAAVAGLCAGRPLLRNALLHHEGFRRQPMQFRNRPYLVELYADLPRCPEACARKAVQTGFSELLIQLALERAGWGGRAVAYLLPTFQLRNRFVQTRVDPVLLRVPAYRERLPGGKVTQEEAGPASLALKRFGAGTLYFLGANSPGDFVEFSADTLVVDELDLCLRGGHLHLARDRLRESPDPQAFYIGNPTAPRYGISAEYDASDRRRYHHQCGRCGERQPLDWEGSLVERDDAGRWVARDRERADPRCGEDPRPVCRRCGRPFDRTPDGGGWVAERPGQDLPRGYWLSRLDSLTQRIRPLVDEWARAQGSTEKRRAFCASVLGYADSGSGDRADRETVLRCATGPLLADGLRALRDAASHRCSATADPKRPPVSAGVDVGSVLHVQISTLADGARRTAWVGTVPTFPELRRLLREVGAAVAVVDAGPETHAATDLRDSVNGDLAHPTTVWLCRFHPTARVSEDDYGRRLDEDAHVVTVDRTQVLDATLDDLRAGPPARVLPSDVGAMDGFCDQMAAPARRLSDDRSRYIWDEGNAPDHYRFADAYDRVAADLYHAGGGYLVLGG